MIRLRNGGRIINVASIAAKRGYAAQTAYVASKFAVAGLTQCSALDLAPYGITVNAVCPGTINTNRLNSQEVLKARQMGMSLEELGSKSLEQRAKTIPVGRVGEPEDVANLIGFLASPEAAWITGQAYNVNGGELFH